MRFLVHLHIFLPAFNFCLQAFRSASCLSFHCAASVDTDDRLQLSGSASVVEADDEDGEAALGRFFVMTPPVFESAGGHFVDETAFHLLPGCGEDQANSASSSYRKQS